MITILPSNHLIQRLSFYNSDYYCIIDKVEFLPGILRVYIDERGDGSFGPLQDPRSLSLGILIGPALSESKKSINGTFSVSDASRHYLGYLDFAMDNSFFNGENVIGFEYGISGYSTAKLFRFDQELINKYHLRPT